MTESEAIKLANTYVSENIPYATPIAVYAVYIQACNRPELHARSDAWVVHYSRILNEEVESEEPSTVGILVDTESRILKLVTRL